MFKYIGLFAAAFLTACSTIADDGAPTQHATTLENTYWKLVQVGDSPVNVGPGQRQPHLILRGDDHRVSGFTGCNQMMGGYTLDGQALSFTQMASTRMACIGEAMNTEAMFTAALKQVQSWSTTGNKLMLSDASGQPVIVLQSGGPVPDTL